MPSATATGAPPPLEQVLRLFTGPAADGLYSRHMAALERLCKSNAAGFPIKDLPQVQQLLELTMALISSSGMMDFVPLTVNLIKTLTKPFVKTTSTDEFRLTGNITSILHVIGQVLLQDCPQSIQLAASEMLMVFAAGYGTRPNAPNTSLPALEELSTNSPLRQYLFNQKLLAESGAVQLAVRGLARACLAPDEVMMMSLALTLTQMSHHPGNTQPLLQAGILACLPQLLAWDYTHPLVNVSVELLWNLLECVPQAVRDALVLPQPSLTQVMEAVTLTDTVSAALLEPEPVQVSNIGDNACNNDQAGEVALQQQAQVEQQREQPVIDAGGHQTCDTEVAADTGQCNETSSGPEQPADMAADLSSQQAEGLSPASTESSEQQPVISNTHNPAVAPSVLPVLAATLTRLFKSALLQGYRAVDKELRNDMLVVINLILGTDYSQPSKNCKRGPAACGTSFCKTVAAEGLFEALLAIATSPELGSSEHAGLVKAWALTTEESDQELKLLSWRACVAACVHLGPHSPVLPLAKQWGLMRVLLAFADVAPDEMQQPSLASAAMVAQKRWQADAMQQLRLAALSRLHTLAPVMPEAYLFENGQQVIMRLLQMGSQPACVEAALRHLHHLVLHVPEMAEVLGEGGGLRTLLDVLQDVSRTQAACHFCLLLLARLCRLNCENLRRLRHEGGVLTLIGVLVQCKGTDHTLPSTYTVAALDAVWACVVPDRKNTAKFLVEDGMDLLLELLETSNRGHRAVLLCVLCDLLDNQRSHSFFHAWKSSRDGRRGAQLLLQVWREEDAARGMTHGGLLANTEQPLAGTGRRAQWVPQEGITYASLAGSLSSEGGAHVPALATMLQFQEGSTAAADTAAATMAAMLDASSGERMLAKVYGCFRLLGFSNFTDLSHEDAATLALVEMYVKFRQGELWQQMREEFDAAGMWPTSPDQARLQSGIDLAQHLAATVRGTQTALLDKQRQQAQEAEAVFFDNMRAQRKLEHEARFYQKDKSQLTIPELRAAKQKKEAMLRSSIQHVQLSMTEPNTSALIPSTPA